MAPLSLILAYLGFDLGSSSTNITDPLLRYISASPRALDPVCILAWMQSRVEQR